jgi:hypothetical protein
MHGVATVWSAFGDRYVCASDLLLSAAYCALAGISDPSSACLLHSILHKRVVDASAGINIGSNVSKNHASFALKRAETLYGPEVRRVAGAAFGAGSGGRRRTSVLR